MARRTRRRGKPDPVAQGATSNVPDARGWLGGFALLACWVPTAQRETIPGILVGRDTVPVGVRENERAPERAIVGRRDYGGPVRLQPGIQIIGMIAVDPERHAPSRMRRLVNIHPRFAKTEGDGVGIEEDEIRSVEARIGHKPQRLRVEGARGGEVAHLQTDEIGTAKSCHELPFP
jgi:hypothetical protein